MSAQDDLLAAFGEPRAPRAPEPVESIEPIEPIEQAEPTESAEVPKAAETPETGETSEAGEPAMAPEAEVAAQAPAAAPAVSQPEFTTQPETVVLPAEPAAEPEPVAPSEAAPVIGEQAGPDTVATQVSEVSPQVSVPVFDPPQLPPQQQPYLDPAAFFAQLQNESAAQIQAPPAKPRWPRLLLRYASALVVAGALGVGVGYAITLPKRTNVPFLATPSDGRYVFPAMFRPQPPAGKPAPAANDNDARIHYGDLRQYLVAAPIGLTPPTDDWESVKDFDATLTTTDVNFTDHLTDQGLRHIARRSWRTLDGQHTVVELLQFPDRQAAFAMQGVLDDAAPAHAGKAQAVVPQVTVTSLGDYTFDVPLRTFDEVDGKPGQKERRVVFGSGDVVAIVTTTAPDAVPDVPTEQIVLLQAQMLR